MLGTRGRWLGLATVVACGPSTTPPGDGGGSSSTATSTSDSNDGASQSDGMADETGTSTGPQVPPPTVGVREVRASEADTCVLADDGNVVCWGSRRGGVLGLAIGSESCRCSEGPLCCQGDDEPVIPIPSLGGPVVELTLGRTHACALLEGGIARCWGEGRFGALGLGNTNIVGDDEFPSDVPPLDLSNLVAIAASDGDSPRGFADPRHGHHTCAMLATGELYCWGDGQLEVLGTGTSDIIGDDEPPHAAGAVELDAEIAEFVVGGAHSCVRLVDGTVRCWGFNDVDGVLGLRLGAEFCHPGESASCKNLGCCAGLMEPPATLPAIELGAPAVQLAAGARHTCAVLEGGGVRCWGNNRFGQLGYGHTDNLGNVQHPGDAPLVDVGEPVLTIAAGLGHTCALLAEGRVRCWGANNRGQLGYGHTVDIGDDEPPSSAGFVDLGRPAVALALGGEHTCALLDDGTLRCFGNNGDAQLGHPIDAECYDEEGRFSCTHGESCCIGDDELPAERAPVPL